MDKENLIIDILKLFSDNTRLRILNILSESELCVCDIETILNLNQSNISRHLNKIGKFDIVKSRRDSYWSYYKINDEIFYSFPFIKKLLDQIKTIEPFKNDLENSKKIDKNKNCKI
jgi:ArsR family transcriptional regulator